MWCAKTGARCVISADGDCITIRHSGSMPGVIVSLVISAFLGWALLPTRSSGLADRLWIIMALAVGERGAGWWQGSWNQEVPDGGTVGRASAQSAPAHPGSQRGGTTATRPAQGAYRLIQVHWGDGRSTGHASAQAPIASPTKSRPNWARERFSARRGHHPPGTPRRIDEASRQGI